MIKASKLREANQLLSIIDTNTRTTEQLKADKTDKIRLILETGGDLHPVISYLTFDREFVISFLEKQIDRDTHRLAIMGVDTREES